MKLKDSTFAIIAEKKDSISHKWFNDNLEIGQCKPIGDEWEDIMEYQNGLWLNFFRVAPENYPYPIYTESEFEAILKAEEFAEGVKVEAKADYSKETFGTENIVINKPLEFSLNEPQITIYYNLALEYIAERLNVDKGIIKIEMP